MVLPNKVEARPTKTTIEAHYQSDAQRHSHRPTV